MTQPQESRPRLMVFLTVIGLIIAGASLFVAYRTFVDPKPPREGTTWEERAPYIDVVEGLCNQTGVQFQSIGPMPQTSDLNRYAGYVERINAAVKQLYVVAWTSMSAPVGDEETVISMLSLLERAIRETDEIVLAARGGDLDLVDKLVDRQRDIVATLREETARYGFDLCSRLFRGVTV